MLIPLADRAAEARRRRPILRDERAVEIIDSLDHSMPAPSKGIAGGITVLRTAIYDSWVRRFLAEHPAATVVEIGTGLNTRFDRVDNGRVHWIDLDLPDSIALRRNFFTDTDRRRMVVGSVLADDWLDTVAGLPGPHLFVAEGVLVYLPRAEVEAALTRIAGRFPGALLAFDTYHGSAMRHQHRAVAKGRMDARWSWACENPREFESTGLRLVESTTIGRPPRDVWALLSPGYRVLLTVLRPLLNGTFDLNLYREAFSTSPAEPGH